MSNELDQAVRFASDDYTTVIDPYEAAITPFLPSETIHTNLPPSIQKTLAEMSHVAGIVDRDLKTTEEIISQIQVQGSKFLHQAAQTKQLRGMIDKRDEKLREWLANPEIPELEDQVRSLHSRIQTGQVSDTVDTGAVEEAFVNQASSESLSVVEEGQRVKSRMLTLQRILKSASEESDDEGFFGKALDYVGLIAQGSIPFLNNYRRSDDLPTVDGSWWISTTAEEQLAYLLTAPDSEIEEFAKQVRSSGSIFGENKIALMLNLQGVLTGGKSQEIDDTLAVIDAALIGAIAGSSGVRALQHARSTRQLEHALGSSNPISPVQPEKVTTVLPSGATRNGVTEVPPPANTRPITDLESIIEDNEAVQLYQSLSKGESLSGNARLAARQSALKSLTSSFSPSQKKIQARIVDTDIETNLYGIEEQVITLGKDRTGGGYPTQKSAKRAMERLGRDGEIVQNPTTELWYMKFKRPVTETGFADDIMKPEDMGGGGAIARFILSPQVTSNKALLATAKQSLASASRLNAEVILPAQRAIRAIRGKRSRVFEKIIADLRDEASLDTAARTTWYSRAEFSEKYVKAMKTDRGLDKALVAYEQFQKMADLDYFVRNELAYRNTLRGNWGTLRPLGMDAKPISRGDINFDKGVRAYDMDGSGLVIRSQDDITDMLDNNGYQAYRLRTPHTFDKSQGAVNVVLTKTHKLGDLEYRRIGYRPGGHRVYEGGYYAKQSNRFEDAGKSYVASPLVHISAQTQKQAAKWVDEMNEIRDTATNYTKNGLTKDEADTLIAETSPLSSIQSVDDYVKAVDEGIIGSSEFKVVKDGERIEDLNVGEFSLMDEGETLDSLYMRTNGSGFNSQRSKYLLNPEEEKALVLSPLDSLDRMMSSVVNAGLFSRFQQRSVDNWVSYANRNQLLLKNSHNDSLKGVSPYEAFLRAQLDPRHAEANAMNAQRDTIKRALGVPDPLTKWYRSQRQRMADYAFDERGTWKGKVLKPITEYATDPIGTMKGIAFDLYLGLLNPDQLLVQTQTLIVINSIAPGYGLRSMSLSPLLMAAHGGKNTAFTKSLASKLSPFTRLSGDDAAKMIDEFRESGWGIVDSNIALLDTNSYSHMAKSGRLQDVREKMRVFFYKAEQMNRSHAYSVAWMKFKDKFPSEATNGKFGKQWILDEADRLTQSMTTVSQAAWQKGLASFPTQFLSYNAHLLENILPVMVGGNKHLSAGEKARVAAAQALMYGTAGVPIVAAFGDELSDTANEALFEDTQLKEKYETHLLLTRGMLDGFIRHTTGVNSDMSARAGVGFHMYQMYRDIADASLIEAFSGPGGVASSNLFQSFYDVGRIAAASNGDMALTASEFGDFLRSAKSIDLATKAYMAWNSGMYTTKNDNIGATDVSKVGAVLLPFGFGPSESRDVFNMLTDSKKRSAAVKSVQKLHDEQIQLAVQALKSGDRDLFDRRLQLASSFVNGLPQEDRKRIKLDPTGVSFLDELLNQAARRGDSEAFDRIRQRQQFNEQDK